MKHFIIITSLILIPLIGLVKNNFLPSKYYKQNSSNQQLTTFRVYKIDSINSYYLIYAKKGVSIYKIVSKKVRVTKCDKININSNYGFKLHSSLHDRQIGAMKFLAQNSLLVNCFYYDKLTSICLEGDSIRDLYSAENLKGLCFTR